MLRLILVIGIAHCLADVAFGGSLADDENLQRRYLERFNHLGAYNPDPLMAAYRVSNPREELKMAVKSFQRFAGLNMTGVVDSATVAMMEAPRCGVADLQNNMGSVSRRRRRRYTVQGQKWTKDEVTYRIRNHMREQTMTAAEVKQVLRRAFDTWSDHIPVTFREIVGQLNVDNLADIEISFGSGNHGDQSPFDGRGQTLAHAYFPGLGIGGDMHFDDDEKFTANTPDGTNLLQVAIHELGHSLGLGHSENQDAIMAPFYRKYIPENILKLHMDDVNGIKYLYPGTKKGGTTAKPTVGPDVPVRPTPGRADSVSNFCIKVSVDAVDAINGIIHLFYDDKYLQLNDDGTIRDGFPKLIKDGFPGVPDKLDAVLSLERLRGPVYFFKGAHYWVYNKTRPNDIRRDTIQSGLGQNLENIDAAFIWGGSGAAYFIKGDQYYRYSLYARRMYAPRSISEWKNMPSRIDDAFQHPTTFKTYIFSGKKYYVVNDMSFSVQLSGDTYDWVHCCNILLEAYKANFGEIKSSSPSSRSSMLSFVALVVVGLFFGALPVY